MSSCISRVMLASALLTLQPIFSLAADLSSLQGEIQQVLRKSQGMTLFKEHVRGILENNCLECHGGDEIEGDFDISTRESLMDSGLVSTPAKQSDIFDSISHRFEPYMPHERDKLEPEEIDLIAQWIDLGAPYDRPLSYVRATPEEESLDISEKDRHFLEAPYDQPLTDVGTILEEDPRVTTQVDRIYHEVPYDPPFTETGVTREEDILEVTEMDRNNLEAPFDRLLADIEATRGKEPLVITDKDRKYWAYRTLAKPNVPEVENTDWPRSEIDHFILAKQEAEGLTPNKSPPPETLIRRAYLNAIGLPPTPEEVAAYVDDDKPLAYERMIDRLLDSPHYGERWAQHWMDIARFAESTGFEIDFDRPYAYHYRDFLIKAFNQNVPYNQFIQWQVAGDELLPDDPLALAATGFLAAGPFPSVLTEKEFESSRYDELDDMVNTLGTAMLGTTIGCARCHDHKYDPITSDDYYKLASIFSRTRRSYLNYDPDPNAFRLANTQWTKTSRRLAGLLSDYEKNFLENPFQAWLASGSFDVPLERWMVLSPDTFSSREGSRVEKLWDDSLLLTGRNPEQETEILFVEAETTLRDIIGLRMEALTHPTLPNNGPGRDHEGGFTIRDLTVHIQELGTSESKWKKVALESVETSSLDHIQSLGAAAAVNQISNGWSIDLDGFGKSQALVLRFAELVGFEAGTRIKITVHSGFNIQQMIGRPRFSITQDPRAPVKIGEDVPVFAYQGLLKLLVGLGPKSLKENEIHALRHWYGRNNAGWIKLWKAFVEHQLLQPRSSKTRIMVSSDSLPPIWHRSAIKGFPSFYESTYYLERGDVNRKGAVAKPYFPQVLIRDGSFPNSWMNAPTPRIALASWLTDVEEGAGSLLARVFVNRLWHHHFGRGMVFTPSDFGTQGGDPTHPELLEWLAWDFVYHGWNIKRLQKQIMTSAAYRQSSKSVSAKSVLDAENRLLWKFSSRRVEAEVVRDSMLHVSGMLDRTMYGPGSRDPDMRRRSIYFFIKRGAMIPEMMLFDSPEHLVGIGQRASTTTAPQALQFLNSPQTRQYAEAFADRLSGESTMQLILNAYQLALGRVPDSDELLMGLAFIESQEKTYRERGYNKKMALIDYCQSLFGLNEFIYIR